MMFDIGDSVSLKVDENVKGIIVKILPAADGVARYRVFHDATRMGEYYEDQLCPVDLEANVESVDPRAFPSYYAKIKLSQRRSSSIFSLNAGNIKFIPYQFRPLKKIIKAERPRMLISDEVGVGKTIETGILLKEYERRENVRSVVIVCPKELCSKWQREMKTRFDEAFNVIDANAFSYCLQEMKLDGAWPVNFEKCILSLEMLRRSQNIEKLMQLEVPVHFDMLVVDEAHHVVNDSSLSYKAVSYLSDNSDIAVFLSATPIQLKSRDLFVLLNMLLPEEFEEERLFDSMAQPNHYINAAIRSIRNSLHDGWQQRALEELEQVSTVNKWARQRFEDNPQLTYWTRRLADSDTPISNDERIACLRDLEELHTFSHVINRTKRRDIGEFTLREPHTVEIEYCAEETDFYKAAREFEFAIYSSLHGARTATMIMSTIERLMTSCLPAFALVLDDFIGRGMISLDGLADDIDLFDTGSEVFDMDEDVAGAASKLRGLALRLPATDAKTERLLEIIRTSSCESDGGKLLVFSFFKNTLRYLLDKIGKTGVRVALITGETPNEARDDLRARFRLPKTDQRAIDVLLSSEVGCEGLDYEFCSRMVNYDIPWNPMKIEQRIGRIDRFGQKSPKVIIYNFITKGTVEERIFFRCYERLGVFSSTIGDLEGVLGEVQSELTRMAFDLTLDEEQCRVKAQQSVDNAIRDRDEQEEFEANSRDLFLMDLDEDDNEVGRERVAQMGLLSALVSYFIEKSCPGAQITTKGDGSLVVRFKKSHKRMLLEKLRLSKSLRRADAASQQYAAFEKFLIDEDDLAILTFDASTESSVELLITLDHPLTRFALENINDLSFTGAVALVSSSSVLPSGTYSYACYEWEERGYRESSNIVVAVRDADADEVVELEPPQFEMLMLLARLEEPAPSAQEDPALDDAIRRKQLEARTRLEQINEDVVRRKLSTLDSSFQRKIDRAQSAAKKTDSEKIRLMRRHQVKNLENARVVERERLLARLRSDVIVRKFAYGTIDIVEA